MSRLVLDKPVRIIEFFAGIGTQIMSLKDLGVDVESWLAVDFDKYAIKSYNAIHGTDYEPIDICDVHAEDLNIVDTDDYIYILTYSFPCQSLSLAGLKEGYDEGSGTKSSLLWEVLRILRECRDYDGNLPKILLMENVTQVHSDRHKNNWEVLLESLEELGYRNYWKDLNAKDYGFPNPIPQNRNRTFMVSVLGDEEYMFPQKQDLDETIRDYKQSEDEIDDCEYVTNEGALALIEYLKGTN